MATYVPNASNTAEPTSSRFVGSAAEEFRTLKTKLASDVAALNVKATQTVRAPGSETLSALPAAATRATHLPYFSATGDVAVTDFTVDQIANAIAAAYVSGTTADALAFLAAGTGAVSRTVQNKERDFVSIFDFLTLAEQLDVIAGGLNYDLSAKVQAAIDARYAAGGGELFAPAGSYKHGAPIYMKLGVSIVGPEHKVSSGQLYEASTEGALRGVARFVPSSSVTTAAVFWDYSWAVRAERPYGAVMKNIIVDGRYMTGTADCVRVMCTPASEGPFNNGWASGATRLDNCILMRAPRYGAGIWSTNTEKTNAGFRECRFAFNGSHGLYAYLTFDIMLDHCFSFANVGDGLYFDGCATQRVLQCDIFNNQGHGVTDDGYDGRYEGCAVENNYKHGYNILATNSTITHKKIRILGGRCSTNSYGADATYSNVYLGSRSGTAITGVLIENVSFGLQAHVGTTNRVKNEVESAALSTQNANTVVGCAFSSNDLKTGNTQFNDNFKMTARFANSEDAAGQPIAQKRYPLTAGTGSFWAPNILRGVDKFVTQNTASAILWGFNFGTADMTGREIDILINDSFTGVDFSSTTLKGNGGVDLAAGASLVGKVLRFTCFDGTNWACTIQG